MQGKDEEQDCAGEGDTKRRWRCRKKRTRNGGDDDDVLFFAFCFCANPWKIETLEVWGSDTQCSKRLYQLLLRARGRRLYQPWGSSAVSAMCFRFLCMPLFVDLPSHGYENALLSCAVQHTEYVVALAPAVAFFTFVIVIVSDPIEGFRNSAVVVFVFDHTPHKVDVISAVRLDLAEDDVASLDWGCLCRWSEKACVAVV